MQQRIALPKRLHTLNQVLLLLLLLLPLIVRCTSTALRTTAGSGLGKPVMQTSEQEVGRPTATSDLLVWVRNGAACAQQVPFSAVRPGACPASTSAGASNHHNCQKLGGSATAWALQPQASDDGLCVCGFSESQA